jgi:outer membrane protein assembly factor BamB
VLRTYVLLLSVLLGFCPQNVFGGQRPKKIEPLVTPLFPAEQAWQVALTFPPSANAAMDDTRVYVPLEGEHFAAFDRATGAVAWTADIESAWPPLVHDGVVYLAASDELHALDAATGNHRWRIDLGRGAMAPMAMTTNALIVLVAPDEVWAFKPSDGGRLWVQPLGGRSGRVSMAVDATGIYVGLVDRLIRVTPETGAIRWDVMLPGQLAITAVARDRIFAGSTTNEIYALDPDSGRLIWKFPRFGGDVVGITATKDHVFVVSLDNVLRGLNRGNGNQIWKRVLTFRPVGSPQVFDGIVAVSGAESVASFNSKTGMPIGTFESPNLLQGPLLVDATPAPFAVSILAVTRDGRLIGLNPTEMMFKEQAVQPLTALPGRPLAKELSPLPSGQTPVAAPPRDAERPR